MIADCRARRAPLATRKCAHPCARDGSTESAPFFPNKWGALNRGGWETRVAAAAAQTVCTPRARPRAPRPSEFGRERGTQSHAPQPACHGSAHRCQCTGMINGVAFLSATLVCARSKLATRTARERLH